MKAIINKTIDIKLSSNYQFILGQYLIDELYNHLGIRGDQKVLIISDEIVWKLYGMKVDSSFSSHTELVDRLIFNFGEEEKNLDNLYKILNRLAENSFKKSDVIVAVGGGVICDIAGLAAGLYMRGISHVLVPTTTLSAIDASVGGKTAVNMPQAKNLIGMFKQPSRVICDIEAFASLSDRIFYEGLVEAIKMAFIGDYKILGLFDKNLRNDRKAMMELVSQAVKGKYNKIKTDEYDDNHRQVLNFGHSLGHAIEKLSNYNIRHGEAVALGMLHMIRLSEDKGYLLTKLPDKELIKKYGDIQPSQLLVRILMANKLPYEFNYTYEELEKYLLMDKKSRQDYIKLVMLEGLGKPKLEMVEINKLKEYLQL